MKEARRMVQYMIYQRRAGPGQRGKSRAIMPQATDFRSLVNNHPPEMNRILHAEELREAKMEYDMAGFLVEAVVPRIGTGRAETIMPTESSLVR